MMILGLSKIVISFNLQNITSMISPMLMIKAPGMGLISIHLPSFLTCKPWTSFAWSGTVNPVASECGEIPITLLAHHTWWIAIHSHSLSSTFKRIYKLLWIETQVPRHELGWLQYVSLPTSNFPASFCREGSTNQYVIYLVFRLCLYFLCIMESHCLFQVWSLKKFMDGIEVCYL